MDKDLLCKIGSYMLEWFNLSCLNETAKVCSWLKKLASYEQVLKGFEFFENCSNFPKNDEKKAIKVETCVDYRDRFVHTHHSRIGNQN